MKLRAALSPLTVALVFWTVALLAAWTVERAVAPTQQAGLMAEPRARRVPSMSTRRVAHALIAPTVTPAGPRAVMSRQPAEVTQILTAKSGAHPAQAFAPAPTVAFSFSLEPGRLRVGERLTVTLTLENRTDQAVHGVGVFSAGPWDAFTVVQVVPPGPVEANWLGATFSSPSTIEPGQSMRIQVVAAPREPIDAHFTFTPTALGDRHLPRLAGPSIVFEGDVEVMP